MFTLSKDEASMLSATTVFCTVLCNVVLEAENQKKKNTKKNNHNLIQS